MLGKPPGLALPVLLHYLWETSPPKHPTSPTHTGKHAWRISYTPGPCPQELNIRGRQLTGGRDRAQGSNDMGSLGFRGKAQNPLRGCSQAGAVLPRDYPDTQGRREGGREVRRKKKEEGIDSEAQIPCGN